MRIDLPRGIAYSYSLAPEDVVDVAVLQGGPVEHRSYGAVTGPVDGGVASGATQTFDVAGTLVAPDGAAVVELTYRSPGIPETLDLSPPNTNDNEEEATDE